jgi:hypothetical protein
MGMMYKEGKGVKQDYKLAYALLDVATRDGHGGASKMKKEIEFNLAEKELIEAQKLASQWEQGKPIIIPAS